MSTLTHINPSLVPSTLHSCLYPLALWDQTQPSAVEDAEVVTSMFCFSQSSLSENLAGRAQTL